MTDKDLSQDILKKIKDKKIKPKPKWEFVAKDYLVLLFVFLSILFGSLATSVVIYMIDNNDWDLYNKINGNLAAFVLSTLPYFWLVVLTVMLILIYFNFRNTKGGYKYHSYSIITTSILISVILGFVFYNLGLAQTIDIVFEDKVPMYRQIQQKMQTKTANPDKGVLIGKPQEVIDQQKIIVLDFNNKKWYVIVKDKPVYPQIVEFPRPVIFIGQKIDEQNFSAAVIRPVKCRTQKCPHMQALQNLFKTDERNLAPQSY